MTREIPGKAPMRESGTSIARMPCASIAGAKSIIVARQARIGCLNFARSENGTFTRMRNRVRANPHGICAERAGPELGASASYRALPSK